MAKISGLTVKPFVDTTTNKKLLTGTGNVDVYSNFVTPSSSKTLDTSNPYTGLQDTSSNLPNMGEYLSGKKETPVVAPVVTPVVQPTVVVKKTGTGSTTKSGSTPVVVPPADSAAGIASGATGEGYTFALSEDEKAAKDAASAYLKTYNSDLNQTIDPETEYANKLAMYQTQIDATNKVYADKLNTARIEGAGRIESRKFSQGRSGQIGSGTGEAGVNAVQDANTQVYNSIQDEQNASISAILSEVRNSAEKSLADKTAAKKAGADALLTYYDNKPTRDAAALKPIIATLISKGIDPSKMSVEDLAAITNGLGISKETVMSAYGSAVTDKKSAETKASKEQSELDQTLAQTAKTKADTEMIGKMTPAEKANLAEKVREFGLTYALDKYKAENPTTLKTTTYDSQTIPETEKADLLTTIKNNPKSTFADISAAFPLVDTKYIADIINNVNQ